MHWARWADDEDGRGREWGMETGEGEGEKSCLGLGCSLRTCEGEESRESSHRSLLGKGDKGENALRSGIDCHQFWGLSFP